MRVTGEKGMQGRAWGGCINNVTMATLLWFLTWTVGDALIVFLENGDWNEDKTEYISREGKTAHAHWAWRGSTNSRMRFEAMKKLIPQNGHIFLCKGGWNTQDYVIKDGEQWIMRDNSPGQGKNPDLAKAMEDWQLSKVEMYEKYPQLMMKHARGLEEYAHCKRQRLMGDFNEVNVIYIFGSSEIGKTRLAHKLCKEAGGYMYVKPMGVKWYDGMTVDHTWMLMDDCDSKNVPAFGDWKVLTGGYPVNVEVKMGMITTQCLRTVVMTANYEVTQLWPDIVDQYNGTPPKELWRRIKTVYKEKDTILGFTAPTWEVKDIPDLEEQLAPPAAGAPESLPEELMDDEECGALLEGLFD